MTTGLQKLAQPSLPCLWTAQRSQLLVRLKAQSLKKKKKAMQLITVQKCTKINVIPHDTVLCEIGHKASVLFYTFLGAMQVGTYFPIKRTHINVIQEVLPEGGSCILLYGKFYRKAFPVDSYMGSWYGKPVPAWSVRKQTNSHIHSNRKS